MEVKQCLKCGKEFESKTGKAKFCSVSCRVIHHRKNGAAKVKEMSVHSKVMENLSETKRLNEQIRNVLANIKVPTINVSQETFSQPQNPYAALVNKINTCLTMEQVNEIGLE